MKQSKIRHFVHFLCLKILHVSKPRGACCEQISFDIFILLLQYIVMYFHIFYLYFGLFEFFWIFLIDLNDPILIELDWLKLNSNRLFLFYFPPLATTIPIGQPVSPLPLATTTVSPEKSQKITISSIHLPLHKSASYSSLSIAKFHKSKKKSNINLYFFILFMKFR